MFRTPITLPCLKPSVRSWVKPITIARHAYGDIYKCTEYRVPGPGTAELLFKDAQGKEIFHETVFDFKCPGVLMGTYNKDDSIQSFARACFNFALATKQDLWFSAKDTISKSMTTPLKTSSRRSLMPNIRPSSRKPASLISIP